VVGPRVVRAGHVVLYVTDLARSREFYEGFLGLQPVHATADAAYLRGYEEREWSLKLQRNSWPGLKHLAFKVWEEEDLERAVALARELGLPWREEEEFDRPRMVRLQDPFGFPVVFYRRAGRYPSLLQAYHQYRGPAPQRLDHFNLFCPHVPAALKYYTERLGFRLTEYTVDHQERVWAAWLQRKGNVHDVALTTGQGPRLHHFAYWVPDPCPCCGPRTPWAAPGGWKPSSGGPAGTASATPCSCTSATPTGTGWNCTRATTWPWTRSSSPCAGTWTTRAARPCGATGRPTAGSRREAPWRTSPEARRKSHPPACDSSPPGNAAFRRLMF
jgi:catechol 2,3-dioxygenase-like lactoylglutathione lyase family enzyme